MKRIIKTLIFSSAALLSLSACSGTDVDHDANKGPEIIATNGSIVIEPNAVNLPTINDNRTLRIYLPPSYSSASASDKRYPVLYMHDAQNLFDASTSFAGEWNVDETLDSLYQESGFELIVVGIDNHPQYRHHEYSAWDNSEYGEGRGDKFVADIVNAVKPYIDNKYRTLSDKDNTAMMGSSLGGLLTHYAVAHYPNTFSKAGVFSPSYWYAPAVYQFTATANIPTTQRWYFLAGDQEGGDMVNKMNQMIEQMLSAGHSSSNLDSKVIVGGKHNEYLWRTNFKTAVRFLFNIN